MIFFKYSSYFLKYKMDIQNSIPLKKLVKLQEMALVKYQRCQKRYDLALGEWKECQKPYSIEDNLQQYEVSSRILSDELNKQMRIVEKLQVRLEAVQKAMDTLKNNPEQVSILHDSEIETAREKMETAYQNFKTAEQRYKELEQYTEQDQN